MSSNIFWSPKPSEKFLQRSQILLYIDIYFFFQQQTLSDLKNLMTYQMIRNIVSLFNSNFIRWSKFKKKKKIPSTGNIKFDRSNLIWSKDSNAESLKFCFPLFRVIHFENRFCRVRREKSKYYKFQRKDDDDNNNKKINIKKRKDIWQYRITLNYQKCIIEDNTIMDGPRNRKC